MKWGAGEGGRNIIIPCSRHPAVNPYARRGSGAEVKAAAEKNGNMENVKAWFHMRGAEAKRQAEAARNFFFSARGSDSCRSHGLSLWKRGVARFPQKSSQDVWRSR